MTSQTPSYTENGTGDVAQYSATNPGNDTIVWSLQGDDADDFVIHENNGTLLFGAPPDYEDATDSNSDNVYNVAVVASDGSVEGELDVTVTVTNVNEKPEFTEGSSTSRNVDEGDQADRPVGNPVTATDQDASDTLIYSLSGTDSSSFDIDSSTGQIKTKDALDSDEQPWLVDLNMYFSDPDGDSLEYDFTGQNITDVALAHLVGGTLSIDPVSGGDVSFYVVATDSGDLSAVTSVSVSVTEPEPVPTPAPAVTVPVPVSTPALAVVVPVPTPTVPETVIVEPEPVPTFAPLPPLVEQKIRNQTQETDPVSKVIVVFALEPVDEPMAEVSLPPAAEPAPPQKVSQVDEDAAVGHSPAPLPASLDSSGGGITVWMIILLAMIAVGTAGYGVRMFVIHRLSTNPPRHGW